MNWTYRGFSLILLLAVSLLTGFGLPHLRTDTTTFSLISRVDPDRGALEQVRREFGADQRTRLYVRDDNLWSEAKLLALRELHKGLEQLEFVERVDDLFTHRLLRGKGGELENGVILPAIPREAAELERVRAEVTNAPLLVGKLLSRDGKWTALTLTLKEEMAGEGLSRARYTALEGVVAAHRQAFQELFEIGPQRREAEFHDALVRECLRLAPVLALLVSFVVLLLTRSLTAVLIPLVTAALTLLWTFGIMGWTGIPLTISGALLPPLIIGLAFTNTIPVLCVCRQRAHLKQAPLTARTLMKSAGLPLTITVTVLAAGISAYAATGVGFMREFALAATVAVLANGIALLLLFPHLLASRATCGSGEASPLFARGQSDFLGRVLSLPSHSPASILAFTLLLSAFALYHASRITVSTDAASYLRPAGPLPTQVSALEKKLARSKTFRITLSAKREKAFLEPRNIERLATIQKFMDKQGVFEGSTSLADLLSLANREYHGGSAKHYLPPRKKELIAQYLLLFDRQELSEYASHDLRQATIVVRHRMTNSEMQNAYVKELKNVVDTVAGGRMESSITGEDLMVNRGATLLQEAWLRSLLLLGGGVLLLVSLMFTSPFGGVATLLLAALPLVITLGVMGACQVPLTIGTAMVGMVSTGFLLNGTIYLFGRYSDLCRTTPDYSLAARVAIREAAGPLSATAGALMAGFSLLAYSRFSFVTEMGFFAAAALLISLLTLILPAPLLMARIRLVGLYELLQMSVEQGSLEKSSLFQGMSRYQIKKAILISELHEFEPGMLLVEQGSIGRSMYLILEGEAEVRLRSDSGQQERLLALLQPGQVFGEIGYVRENRRTADVRALTRVQALRFDHERMENDLQFFPFIVAKLNFNVCRILGERLAGVVDSLGHDERRT